MDPGPGLPNDGVHTRPGADVPRSWCQPIDGGNAPRPDCHKATRMQLAAAAPIPPPHAAWRGDCVRVINEQRQISERRLPGRGSIP